MKWPKTITFVRHGQSDYNALRDSKAKDSLYQDFKENFERDSTTRRTAELAQRMQEKYALKVSDYDTPLTEEGKNQARLTGQQLQSSDHVIPDVVFVSPYLRTKETFAELAKEWPNINGVRVIYDDRIREQEHGLSLLYNDWRIFQTLHPEQKIFFDRMGPYWYQYPQGESVSNVRDRIRLFTEMLIREYAEKHVFVVTHHLTILSVRANLERLSPEEFIYLDEYEKPVNCGVTVYKGNPDKGTNGKLELEKYNLCYWK